MAVNDQFFVDLFMFTTPVSSNYVPQGFSGGYIAVGSLVGGASRVITITVPSTVSADETKPVLVFGLVDSTHVIPEANESNNLSIPLVITIVPDFSPTPNLTATPAGSSTVSGVIRSFRAGWQVQNRAWIWLQNQANPTILYGPVWSSENGTYTFPNLPINLGAFTLITCLPTDGFELVGVRSGVLPPLAGADVYLFENAAGCPVP